MIAQRADFFERSLDKMTRADNLGADQAAVAPIQRVPCLIYRRGTVVQGERTVPEETAIAFSYNGTSHAVMMATPSDLMDFAVGFSFDEGIIETPDDIESIATVAHESGIELQIWLVPARASLFDARRRRLVGPTGCGLCGIESLTQALPPVRKVPAHIKVDARVVQEAATSLTLTQLLHRSTRAVHAAGFFVPGDGLVELREDVGRHNALDKLIGALVQRKIDGASGLVVLTSRVSVEMVQKTAVFGASMIVAVSAPTALAIRTAEEAGITLAAVARQDGFEVFSHPQSIST